MQRALWSSEWLCFLIACNCSSSVVAFISLSPMYMKRGEKCLNRRGSFSHSHSAQKNTPLSEGSHPGALLNGPLGLTDSVPN